VNIAVEATCWSNARGYGRHLRSLVRALAAIDRRNRYTLIGDREIPPGDIPPGLSVRVIGAGKPLPIATPVPVRRPLRDLWEASRALSSSDFDLVLFPTVYSYVPVTGRAARVILIHDVIAETFPQLTVPGRMARLAWKLKVTLARLQADALVTVSDYSRQLLMKRFGLRADRLFVAGEAGDAVFRRVESPSLKGRLAGFGIEPAGHTVVYVGGFSPHKNIEGLVRAFARIAKQPEGGTARLVLVGDYERDAFLTNYGRIRTLVATLELQERVIFTGFLEDEDLVTLLNIATVLVLPSLMEGFGLPAVEAAACGCPVIATRESPLPALLGKGGIFIGPTEAEIESALQRVLGSPGLRREMGEAGLLAASKLTWNHAAEQMLEIFEIAVGRRRPL